jgi:hypothetical protein
MASPDGNTERVIPMFTAVHPDREAHFRASAAPKKVIREGRANIAVSCSQCMQPAAHGAELLKCAKVRRVSPYP